MTDGPRPTPEEFTVDVDPDVPACPECGSTQTGSLEGWRLTIDSYCNECGELFPAGPVEFSRAVDELKAELYNLVVPPVSRLLDRVLGTEDDGDA